MTLSNQSLTLRELDSMTVDERPIDGIDVSHLRVITSPPAHVHDLILIFAARD